MVRKGNFARLKKGKKPDQGVESNAKDATGDDVKTEATNKQVELSAKADEKKLKGDESEEVVVSKVPEQRDNASPDFTGLIFMCNTSTKQDCFKYRVFGLPDTKKHLVEQVRRGMRLFLFDIKLRLLYGVYKASSRGGFNLEPDAFRGSTKAFPWQVRFGIYQDCLPLAEDVFKKAIEDNYEDNKRFKIELNIVQVQKLLKLFRPVPKDSGAGHELPGRMAPFSHREAPPRINSGAGHELPGRMAPFSHREAPPRINYDSKLPGRERYPQGQRANNAHRDGIGEDDFRPAREARLWQETPLLNQVNTNLGAPGYVHTSTPLSLYSADPVRSELEFKRTDPYKLGVRDDLFSSFPQGHSLGNPSVEADPLYRQRFQQVPDVSVEPLDRRLYGLDPVVDGSSSYTNISSDILKRRPSGLDERDLMLPPKRHLQEGLLPSNLEYHSRLPYEDSGAISGHSFLSGLTRSYSGADARNYSGADARNYSGVDARSYHQYF